MSEASDSQGDRVNIQKISLDFTSWVKLISLTVAAVAAFFGMFARSQATMYELDIKWQERIAGLAKELKQDIRHVEKSIPPDWFRAMVEDNRKDIAVANKHIDEIEDEVTRSFVRKSELEAILKAMGK